MHADGNLGQGSLINTPVPTPVMRLRGKGVKAVACGDGCTAAISSEGKLYSWGQGLAGQLGHGHAFRVTEPKVVAFPFSYDAVQVRCRAMP